MEYECCSYWEFIIDRDKTFLNEYNTVFKLYDEYCILKEKLQQLVCNTDDFFEEVNNYFPVSEDRLSFLLKESEYMKSFNIENYNINMYNEIQEINNYLTKVNEQINIKIDCAINEAFDSVYI